MTFQLNKEDGLYYRQTLFDKAKRVIVKVGSAVLTEDNGMNMTVIENIAKEIAFLQNSGREVILVSSGAVAAGRKKLALQDTTPLNLMEKQAVAAVGQSCLMQIYEKVFEQHGLKIGQLLLTHSDLSNRDRYLNARNTIFTLLKYNVIPIINENDTVSVRELRFGDNDTLGAMIANLIEADMFICLTDVVGLYTGNPQTDSDARPIYTIAEVTPEVEKMAGNVTSALGTGGMQSKITAAKMVSAGGGSSFIGPGRETDVLKKLFSGEMVGTFFLPKKERMQSRKQWIAYVLRPQGALILDQGATRAVVSRGKSLLPSGIKNVEGNFGVGESVRCLDDDGKQVAVGLVNYCAEDIRKIKQAHSDKIYDILGFKYSDEIMHRDNLVVL